MSKAGELVFIHIWLAGWVAMFASIIWGHMAEEIYDWRMNYRTLLMPGPLADREFYVKWTKRFAYFALPFGILIYLVILFTILTRQ